MRSEYLALRGMKEHPGYAILCALWAEQFVKIEKAVDSAAARGADSAWRYWAGQAKGFKFCVTAIDRALAAMEIAQEDERQESTSPIDKLMAEARGETE